MLINTDELCRAHTHTLRTQYCAKRPAGGANPLCLPACPSCLSLPACRYENIVQIRCLYEGVTVQDMLDNWHSMLPAKMQEWSLDRQQVSAGTATAHILAAAGQGVVQQRGLFVVVQRATVMQPTQCALRILLASASIQTFCASKLVWVLMV